MKKVKMLGSKFKALNLVFGLIITLGLFSPKMVQAEYGDVVINNYSEEAGMRPVYQCY